jgi:hypothetical protein
MDGKGGFVVEEWREDFLVLCNVDRYGGTG